MHLFLFKALIWLWFLLNTYTIHLRDVLVILLTHVVVCYRLSRYNIETNTSIKSSNKRPIHLQDNFIVVYNYLGKQEEENGYVNYYWKYFCSLATMFLDSVNNEVQSRLTSSVPWLVPRLKRQINTNLLQWNFLGDVITIKSLIFFYL